MGIIPSLNGLTSRTVLHCKKKHGGTTHISIHFPARNLQNIFVYLFGFSKDAQSKLFEHFSEIRTSVMYQERCPENLHNARFYFSVKQQSILYLRASASGCQGLYIYIS